MKKNIVLGIDVGSVSVKLAVLFKNAQEDSLGSALIQTNHFFIPLSLTNPPTGDGCLLLSRYLRHHGEPLKCVSELLRIFFKAVPEEKVQGVWTTGSGGRLCSKQWRFRYLNEFRAVAEGVGGLFPEVRTVFELGGERSKYILLSHLENGEIQIRDYEVNGECAAGTGSFFDQQVGRLKYRIEDVGKIVEKVERSASIAGRCSVFAKSDMIHAQQRGYLPPEVLKGLCETVVRNFKGSVTKGKKIESRVALVGGVAANRGVVQAFEEQFDFFRGELTVPEPYAWMGAIGAACVGSREKDRNFFTVHPDPTPYESNGYPTMPPLSLKKVRLLRNQVLPYKFTSKKKVDGFLGIDVGSVSTNLALIDAQGELIYGIYRMTDGRPADVVKDSLKEMASAVGKRVRIKGVGTTGSGRELIGLLVGADVIKDEITAHKTGAIHVSRKYLNGQVDTIFEVGGQDSKFISIKQGVVVDFSLNEACAAGTGSFLEEQARQINIAIRGEFAELALRSKHPLKLGERCTVFMEKEVVPYLQRGVPKEDIVAGLALSVVQNYLNRVVKKRRIGEVIFFQGGTAYNDSVAAAFSTILNKEIIVPPHNGIIGAIGAALLTQEKIKGKNESLFRGWDLDRVFWDRREFTCTGCTNACRIQQFTVENEKSYWGDKCSERYRRRAKTVNKASIQDLIHFREKLLFLTDEKEGTHPSTGKIRIGIPRALYFFDRLPFWKTYFETLGFEVILSGPSRQHLIHKGVEVTVAEPCFPVQVAHGHLLDILNQKVDFVFLPNIINEEAPPGSVASFLCPWGQTFPLVVKHTPALREIWKKLLYPNIQFREGKNFVERQLRLAVDPLGVSFRENKEAVERAYEAQVSFRETIANAGEKVLKKIADETLPCVVILGRPYNLYDPGLNLNIPGKLRALYGVNVIPMDFLPLERIDIQQIHDHMFWNYGRRILQAARWTKDYPHVHIVYLSNFKCGPDSYIRHYIEDASGEPFLFLQLDSHANDAGVMTRIEAFLESKGML